MRLRNLFLAIGLALTFNACDYNINNVTDHSDLQLVAEGMHQRIDNPNPLPANDPQAWLDLLEIFHRDTMTTGNRAAESHFDWAIGQFILQNEPAAWGDLLHFFSHEDLILEGDESIEGVSGRLTMDLAQNHYSDDGYMEKVATATLNRFIYPFANSDDLVYNGSVSVIFRADILDETPFNQNNQFAQHHGEKVRFDFIVRENSEQARKATISGHRIKVTDYEIVRGLPVNQERKYRYNLVIVSGDNVMHCEERDNSEFNCEFVDN